MPREHHRPIDQTLDLEALEDLVPLLHFLQRRPARQGQLEVILGGLEALVGEKDDVELCLPVADQPPDPLFGRRSLPVGEHAGAVKRAAGAQVRRKALDDAPGDLLTVLPPVAEDVFLLERGHVRRVRHDAVEALSSHRRRTGRSAPPCSSRCRSARR